MVVVVVVVAAAAVEMVASLHVGPQLALSLLSAGQYARAVAAT